MVSNLRQRSSQRRWMILGAVVFLVLISFGTVVSFYTDLLWFQEVDFSGVFWTIIWARLGVGAAAAIIAGLFVWANLEVARRVAPRYQPMAPGADFAEQYRTAFRPYVHWLNLGVAGLVGLLTGLSVSTQWDTFLLWRNARPFGAEVPELGGDVSFYVFSIPFQRAVLGMLFALIIVAIAVAALAHLLNGSINPEPNRVRILPAVKVHVSVLLGVFALLKAWAYRLDQFELVYSPRGTVTGASYTDVNAQLPALRLLLVIMVIAAIIFFVNIRFRGWLLPGAAIALWAFSSLVLGAIIPAAVQRFQVEPNESEREEPFIEHNIEMTREAFALDQVDVQEFPARETLSEEAIEANQGTVQNVRVWNPATLIPTYRRLQAIRTYYDFNDVDIDRYEIDGSLTQVMLSAREVDPSQLEGQAQNWVNTRLTYTHGYGLVGSPANSVTPEGLPELLVQDLPPEGAEQLTPGRGGIYFGEMLPGAPAYAVGNTAREEIDFPLGEEEVQTTHYEGEGGVPLSNVLRRAAFAWRFADTNLLISQFITPDSKLIMRRDIRDRVQTVAPFLRYDRDPYVVAGDERLYWVIDAYTATDRYPYSQGLNLGAAFPQQHRGAVNYMRNSVKVVIDAYDGTMDFFVVDDADPLIKAYQAIFPDLLTPGGEMPDAVREHVRYPADYFLVQALQYRLYHITDAQRLYSREDLWDIPADPSRSAGGQRMHMEPFYVVMRLPGEAREEFVLMVPFTPRERPILNAWMAARSDPEVYGQLRAFSFPRGTSIDGPENVTARIEQNAAISQQFTLWEGAGSNVVRGDLLVIPIEESLIYVQPVYLQAAEAGTALPELRRVIVVVGDNIGFEQTFEESLEAATRGEEPTVVEPGTEEEIPVGEPDDEEEEPEATPEPTPAPAPTGDVFERCEEHFESADEALRRGDLATYQDEVEACREAMREAQDEG